MKQLHSNNFQHKSQYFNLLNGILSVKKIKICLFPILYDEKYINCTFKLNHVLPKPVCFKTDNFSGENQDASASINFLLKNVRKMK